MRALANAVAEDFSSGPTPLPTAATRAGVIRVLIADLHAVALLHVRSMLSGARDVTVVAEVARAHSAALAIRLAPDVIITELACASAVDLATIRSLACAATSSRVLVVSDRPETEWLLDALDAGAAGVLSAHATRDEVLTAVHAIVNGQIVLTRDAIAVLTAHVRDENASDYAENTDSQRRLARLTGREHSVFRLVAEGYSAPEVGARLSISKKTVETYKKRIAEKLGFSHRAEYVRFALEVSILIAPRVHLEA
jgi:DNA-binding NarL/FixJ family response regulator